MNRHAKASSAGSPTRPKGRIKLFVASVAILALALALGVGVASAVAPVVSVENASNVAYTTADVQGHVNPEGQFTEWHFEYATQADFSDAQGGPSGTTETEKDVSGQLGGLTPNTTYHLRLLASNVDGQSESVAASTFKTDPVTQPTPDALVVSGQTGHTAHFSGTVNPNAPEANASLSQAAKDAYKTHWWFTCVPGCTFSGAGEGDIEAAADPLNAPKSVSADATGLQANLPYKVILHARNAGGEKTEEALFATSLSKPEVAPSSVGAYDPSPATALIKGTVNPNNSKVSDCHFVYGIGTPSGNTAPCDPPHPSINDTQQVLVSATSGQFRLTFESETTSNIAFNAAPAAVQSALEGLSSIGAGNVSVSGGPGSPGAGSPYFVEFVEDLSGKDVPQLQAENGTIPLGGKVEVATTQAGGASPAIDETQKITVIADSGQFKLSFGSQTTSDLAFDVSAEEMQAALEGLASIGAGNVTVSGGAGSADGSNPYFVTFQGDLAAEDVAQLTVAPGAKPLAGRVRISEAHTDGSLSTAVEVSAELGGLSPGTEYQYKIVATNAAGTEESAEQYFITPSAPQAENCANSAIRAEQQTTSAECRAFELVSPLDKTNSNVASEGWNVFAAADGDGAVFESHGGFPGTIGSGGLGLTQYLSRRGAAGWSTKSITPTPARSAGQTGGGAGQTGLYLFSEDLRKAILWGYDLPAGTDDLSKSLNLYREDTESGGLETVTQASRQVGPLPSFFFPEWGNQETWGASSDTGVVSFASKISFSPEAIPGETNAYEWDHGAIRLAGILPNGEVPSGGSRPPRFTEQGYRATVSGDGSRLIFVSPAEGSQQLYLRRDHTNTVLVSESESSSFIGEAEGVELQWVSPDAHKLLFTTGSPLLEDDENAGTDLYLYTDSPNPKAQSGNLTMITRSGNAAPPNGGAGGRLPILLGASDDGSRVYFAVDSGENVLAWDHGETRQIASISPSSTPGDPRAHGPMESPGAARVSADGRFLAFLAGPVGSSAIGPTGKVIQGNLQMYAYDAVANTLSCASCREVGPTLRGVPSEPKINPGVISKFVWQIRPNFLSADSRRVFFSTPEALVPEDTNEAIDTYVYNTQTGQRQLISSGRGEEAQWFENASSSGDDVFFVTTRQLVGADRDSLTDLYDARVDGGFAEPPPPPTVCVGDNCRGLLSGASTGTSPSTAAFSGPGNPHRKKKAHHKKRHKRQRHHSKATSKSGARR